MKQIITPKIFRKLLILSFLIIGLFFVGSSNRQSQTAYAAPCCNECEANEAICFSPGHGGYSSYWECAEAYDIFDCYSNCVQCGGGGNCGLPCSGSFCESGWGCGFCIQGTCQ